MSKISAIGLLLLGPTITPSGAFLLPNNNNRLGGIRQQGVTTKPSSVYAWTNIISLRSTGLNPSEDDSIRLAYDRWRIPLGKGCFDQTKFEYFRSNYLMLMQANNEAATHARELGLPEPLPQQLNEYADLSMEEFEAMMGARQPLLQDPFPTTGEESSSSLDTIRDSDESTRNEFPAWFQPKPHQDAASLLPKPSALTGLNPSDDDAIRTSYERWRSAYGKGSFDPTNYENFRLNYISLMQENDNAAMQARQLGLPAPPRKPLNEYADLSTEEYNAKMATRAATRSMTGARATFGGERRPSAALDQDDVKKNDDKVTTRAVTRAMTGARGTFGGGRGPSLAANQDDIKRTGNGDMAKVTTLAATRHMTGARARSGKARRPNPALDQDDVKRTGNDDKATVTTRASTREMTGARARSGGARRPNPALDQDDVKRTGNDDTATATTLATTREMTRARAIPGGRRRASAALDQDDVKRSGNDDKAKVTTRAATRQMTGAPARAKSGGGRPNPALDQNDVNRAGKDNEAFSQQKGNPFAAKSSNPPAGTPKLSTVSDQSLLGSAGLNPSDDDAIRIAYDRWRFANGKGSFDLVRFGNFQLNYLALRKANEEAAVHARQQGLPEPPPMHLNERADLSTEELMIAPEKPPAS